MNISRWILERAGPGAHIYDPCEFTLLPYPLRMFAVYVVAPNESDLELLAQSPYFYVAKDCFRDSYPKGHHMMLGVYRVFYLNGKKLSGFFMTEERIGDDYFSHLDEETKDKLYFQLSFIQDGLEQIAS